MLVWIRPTPLPVAAITAVKVPFPLRRNWDIRGPNACWTADSPKICMPEYMSDLFVPSTPGSSGKIGEQW